MTNFEQLISDQFCAFDANYLSQQATFEAQLAPLQDKLIAIQKTGNSMAASDQQMIECKWFLSYTADWKTLAGKLAAFEKSLDNPDQDWASQQVAIDGSWGPCYDQWFLKVDAMIDAVNTLADQGQAPKYPFLFLAPIATPQKMVAWLESQKTSHIFADGLDRRDALGAVTATLSQMCFKSEIRDYFQTHVKGFNLSDDYIAAYKKWLDDWQDGQSGYWGGWFATASDGVLKSPDLSLTFHNISYQHGKVDLWVEIFATTLAIRDQAYPFGWKHNDDFNNHNNYDVTKIFDLGWSHVDDASQKAASDDISVVLDWCLTKSMTPDGGFIDDPTFYNSVGAAYYYGVSFLDQAGYFATTKPFWTDKPFADGPALCCKIQKKIKSEGLDDAEAKAALEKLVDACGNCT
ncbi:hypothetical protein [Thalassospira lucentensis]|uniref:Uncharacterized protein n=1 Tax=Thalassospira lucentensis TaxID=168935 RepID=A0A358HSD9_9PROT|nr:hypothetical protein [Thalassospira lucentensis]HBU98063.1 hypothetical protein [Thalassospira lucentensis]HCW67525.1 hypothetical protein [Thalassospira lucentensis]